MNNHDTAQESSSAWMNAITTGVFQVPENNPEGPNNTINVVIENPSSKRLTVYWVYEVSDIADYGVNSPVTVAAPFKIVVAPHSTQIHGLSAPSPGSLADSLFRFIFWGDIDLEEKKDKLSIQILAGTSSSSQLTSAKLSSGSASVLFRHENFVRTKIGPYIQSRKSAVSTHVKRKGSRQQTAKNVR